MELPSGDDDTAIGFNAAHKVGQETYAIVPVLDADDGVQTSGVIAACGDDDLHTVAKAEADMVDAIVLNQRVDSADSGEHGTYSRAGQWL